MNDPVAFSRPLFPPPARLAVLISGRGSNFEALAEACANGGIPAKIVLVASDNLAAEGLRKAEKRGIPAKVVDWAAFPNRQAREAALLAALEAEAVDLICLAGFMRILSAAFVARWPLRILNVHPSLLPSFPGLEAQAQALDYGVRLTGATVHFVDAGTDSGPIVAQAAVPVHPGDDAQALAARILPVEHTLYVAALRRVLEGGWRVSGRTVTFPGR
ncbi:MAG TPA: phosphoribosylglycinamide formyltransferase [Candidatus Deferrimicrobium sp.]|nr:phosphoribosylglycinamide formyltransferase [Candidatus Deferrimicrobium sp.]